jgi:hypothetical protein
VCRWRCGAYAGELREACPVERHGVRVEGDPSAKRDKEVECGGK